MSQSKKTVLHRLLVVSASSAVLAVVAYYAAVDHWENGPAREQQREEHAAAQQYAQLCAMDSVEEAAALARLTEANRILRETGIDTRNLQELKDINDTFKRGQLEGAEFFRKHKIFTTLEQLQKRAQDRLPDKRERYKVVYWNGFNDGYVTEQSRSKYNNIRPEWLKN